MTPQTTPQTAFISVTKTGYVEGACLASCPEETARWIAEMGAAGVCVIETDADKAKELLFTTLPVPNPRQEGYGRMIVARRPGGEVEAAGWDCAGTRADAKEWLDRGLTLELVDAESVERLGEINDAHVFATRTPAGEVLTKAQAIQALSGF